MSVKTHDAPPRAKRKRFRRKFRIAAFCKETNTSPATTWRRIKDGTLEVVYYGHIPFIVGGPAGLFDDGDDEAA